MKIKSVEIDTDFGRRIIQISPPLEVDPASSMPEYFPTLIAMLWEMLHPEAFKGAESKVLKVEA